METKYPRTVVIDSPKLKRMLEEKTALVLQGREASIEVEGIQKEMDAIDREIQDIEKTVDLSDLEGKAKAVTDRMNAVLAEMKGVEREIYERLQQKIPRKLVEEYEATKKIKEQRESRRNKLALKAQKKKDVIIPLTQKLAKPHLAEEFEDYSDVRLENGEVVLEIFSHLEDYKAMKRGQVAANPQ